MSIEKVKLFYISPVAEIVYMPQPLSLMASLSIEAQIGEWEEGDEI